MDCISQTLSKAQSCRGPCRAHLTMTAPLRGGGTTTAFGGGTTTAPPRGVTATAAGGLGTATAPFAPAQAVPRAPFAQAAACAPETIDSSRNAAPSSVDKIAFISVGRLIGIGRGRVLRIMGILAQVSHVRRFYRQGFDRSSLQGFIHGKAAFA